MLHKFACTAATLLAFTALGCSATESTGAFSNNGGFLGNCGNANSPACQQVSMFFESPPILLLGDTLAVNASTGGADLDIQFDRTSPVLSFIGSQRIVGTIIKSYARVVVKADAVGMSTVIARHKDYADSASVEVIPASALQKLTTSVLMCPTRSADICELNGDTFPFRDTLTVRDPNGTGLVSPAKAYAARLMGEVTDASHRRVTATIQWSTSDASVAAIGQSTWLYFPVTFLDAVSPGQATITARVGGLSRSFLVHVVK